jgi:ABC-type antimicrobial peptide transport system permease subunit
MLLTSLRIAIKALGRNKMRTALTMLGMTIGVSAVLTMIALGTGAQSSVSSNMKSAGTTLLFVRGGNFTKGGEDMKIATGAGSATSLTADDAIAIGQIPGVAHYSANVKMSTWVSGDGAKEYVPVMGTDTSYLALYGWNMGKGKYFKSDDVSSSANVVVLSPTLKERLFGRDNPVGKEVQIKNQSYKVLGWIKAIEDEQQSEMAFIPFTSEQKLLNINYVHSITISATEAGKATEVSSAIVPLLRTRHHIGEHKVGGAMLITGNQMPGTGVPDDFTVKTQASEALTKGLYTSVAAFILANMPKVDQVNMEEMSGTLNRAGKTMTALLAAIATISLIVGGIGIMNIMLISVTERTREIGIRRAVGARSIDVLNQFLVEALTLGICGGSIGIVLGFIASFVIENVLDWPADISLGAVVMAFGISAATGIFFGFYPARRASKLHPIDALRYE